MSALLDKITAELTEFAAQYDDIDFASVQTGDPGWLMSDQYPYLMVQAGTLGPKSETIGKQTGYNVFTWDFTISIMIDATDYFDSSVVGNDGEGPLVDAAEALLLWFYKVANRRLDNVVEGIRNVTVSSVDFIPDERGEVYARRALLVLSVERQYQHKP